MPYSLVLHCVSPSGTVFPEDLQGQKGLALFLEELIEKQDAALAAQLHAPRNAKPFTTAILHPARTDKEPRTRAAADRAGAGQGMLSAGEMQIRITLLDDALYPRVSQFSSRPQCSKLAMLQCPCRCRACAFRAGSTVGMSTRPCPFSRTRPGGVLSWPTWSNGAYRSPTTTCAWCRHRCISMGRAPENRALWVPAGLRPSRPRSSPRIAKSWPRWRPIAITPAPVERPRWAWA